MHKYIFSIYLFFISNKKNYNTGLFLKTKDYMSHYMLGGGRGGGGVLYTETDMQDSQYAKYQYVT